MNTSLPCSSNSTAADTADALATHRNYLIRFASRRPRDAALVEDVVQETLLAALQQVNAFEARATMRTWLTAILQRRIADAVRRQFRHARPHRADENDNAEPSFDAGDDVQAEREPIDWLDPQRRLEGRQFIDALSACLAQLPLTAARMFALREIEGLDNEQAAQALGLTPRDGAVMLHRTRARLRSGLASHAVMAAA